ncbi:MAG TPA: hypothetical protein VK629_08300 [Steroidobacteraceae bacterium]|nr:hypothetical protein [Steroidobacteraceae bacterium]
MSCANFSLRDGRLGEAWYAQKSKAWQAARHPDRKHVPVVSRVTGYRIPCTRLPRAIATRQGYV